MSFLQQLSDAIDIQQQRQNEEYNELMSRPLQERVNRGYTMTNLHAEFAGIKLRIATPLRFNKNENIFPAQKLSAALQPRPLNNSIVPGVLE